MDFFSSRRGRGAHAHPLPTRQRTLQRIRGVKRVGEFPPTCKPSLDGCVCGWCRTDMEVGSDVPKALSETSGWLWRKGDRATRVPTVAMYHGYSSPPPPQLRQQLSTRSGKESGIWAARANENTEVLWLGTQSCVGPKGVAAYSRGRNCMDMRWNPPPAHAHAHTPRPDEGNGQK